MPPKRPALSSSIGSKTVMALTGLGLLGFVIVHMLGNLQIFAGPEKLNGYAKTLQDLGPLLWVMRGGLPRAVRRPRRCGRRASSRANRAARPVPYVGAEGPGDHVRRAHDDLTSGLIVLAFVVYHLLHFTLGVTHPAHFALQDPDRRATTSTRWWSSASGRRRWRSPTSSRRRSSCLHLSHGASSAFQTLGVTHPRLALPEGRASARPWPP